MKSVNAAARNAIRTAHDVKALPRLTAEWNQNRYNATTVTNNIGAGWESVENDIDMFPIDSIVEPIRPSKGINKARVEHGSVSDGYHNPNIPRYYISSLEDKYQYWISPGPSDGNGNIGSVLPTVMYERSVRTNKIVVTVENSWASPVNWSIQVTSDGGATWQVASSAPVIDPAGRATLYWNGSSWSSNRGVSPANPTTINGMRVYVTRLGPGRDMSNNNSYYLVRGNAYGTTGGNAFFSLIEMSARLEKDLTEDLISVSDHMDAGEANQVTPMGTITSNDGSVTLWNGDGRYSQETTGELRGLIDANVKMNLEYLYYVGNNVYPVQQFSLFAEQWSESDESTVQVQLTDASKFLKETFPLQGKYEKLTLAQIVYRLCDSVGFTDYNIMNLPTINDFRIPVYWTDGSQNLWELFDELATATQSLIFFDAWGRLNVRPRNAGYDRTRAIDWTLRGAKSGTELADIASLEQDGSYSTNTIKVIYKTTEWADTENGHPKFQTVWSPEDTITLRSTPLISGGIGPGDTTFKINPAEATHWPFSGHIQIEGEFIEYEGKLFNYINKKKNAWNPVWLKTEKDYEEMMEDTLAEYRQYSHFTGDFLIKERGVWNSEEVDHIPEAKGWQGKRYNHGTNNAWGTGAFHTWFRGSSVMRLDANSLDNAEAYVLLTRGSEYDTPWKHMGARMRFNGNAQNHRAGIVFNQWGNGDGYYVEFRPTNTIENKDRETEDEVTVFVIHAGNFVKVRSGQRKTDLIVADTWFDVDVYFDANTQRISVWVNGKRVFNETVPGNARHTPNGKFGMWARGKTNVDYEYIYAISRNAKELPDEAGFTDKIRGAYMGDAWLREWVYSVREKTRWVKRKGKKKGKVKKNIKFRKNGQFFDEFGPYVHEVREFDVKFDPAPVAHSKLYFTNDWSMVCPVYRADAFGAYFILANASRVNAIASGEDTLTFAPAGATVNQQLLCYGLPLIFGDDEEVVVRNDAQVRARGEIIAEINSQWIQNEGAAQAVADWIAEHWANGADQLRVKAFGNTLFEIGDVVAIEYPSKNMTTATHQYFVTGVDTQFENGITTNLTLQRKN